MLPLGTGVNVPAEGGNGRNVLVGAGVSVIVAVGGGGVAVGMAAWVSAITVKAAAAIVPCRSTGLAVGVAPVPHALRISVIKVPAENRKTFHNDISLMLQFVSNITIVLVNTIYH